MNPTKILTIQLKNKPMKFYLEITILPNLEIDKHFILSRLFTQIHLGLVALKYRDDNKGDSDKVDLKKIASDKVDIGISFPDYQFSQSKNGKAGAGCIGSKIRLFAVDRQLLEKFNSQKPFLALQDYIDLTNILEVPSNVSSWAIFHRYQPKTSFERLATRYNKREQELLNIINNSQDQIKVNDAKEKLEKRKNHRNNQSLGDYLQGFKLLELTKINLPFINIKSLGSNQHYKIWIKKTATTSKNFHGFSTYGLAQLEGNKNYYDHENKFNNLPAVPIF